MCRWIKECKALVDFSKQKMPGAGQAKNMLRKVTIW